MTPGRDAIVATAAESIARGSKSFAAASRLFDRATRERAWLLYAWCRACDDLADGQDHGHDAVPVDDPEGRLALIRARTGAALAGEWVGDPAFDALRIVVAETAMPHALVWDVVEGFALDAAGWRPASEADLLRYCYHVAGAVGCMMAVVMGVAPEDETVLDRACDLGLAFQLANIARDIGEDAEAGRCYLPGDWLAEAGIAPDAVMADREALAGLARRLCDRAADYAARARAGTPALGFRSAWAVLAAAGIYGDIARGVAARGAAAWDRRVTVPAVARLGWIVRTFGAAWARRSRYRAAGPVPDKWVRPRLPERESSR
ncbi:phytoene synthase [Sphingomonas naasensis]|uniref:Phytoene/squalene synthase family protein n=1 Tax=Sphingomonas naasensis TaxID=1344951 RepID=A0A4S1WIS9_9SPHN|nr:phytoene/squalene synthase family protein [Sphingomonas naasensis]NIJ21453.1 phytoene synthase [Sphingomonas naasensis]TGX41590.1 phytoene/squalene synthase family protein [Sphingomonas naasensis]